MNKKLRTIIDYYGLDKQLKYFQSEVFELNEAIINYKKDSLGDFIGDICRTVKNCFSSIFNQSKEKDPRREHVIEEIADVTVMLKQIQLYYNIPSSEIREVMQYKIQRQIKRIEEEENVKN